jgi:NTE family protein
MSKMTIKILLLFLVVSIQAQQEPIRVGLILSGGGAKGFAHIGVLKALEETGVSVDYIGGTSMGSIVGALYASGYTAAEIEQIALDLDFQNYLEEEIARPNKPFYLKEAEDKYTVKLKVRDNKIVLPSGWTNGLHVMNKLSKYTQHVSAINDFSQLPIPFLCIATDLESGKQVILKKGDLAQSVRASAAFPTVLKPIEIDGKLLVDGGLVNNFPVEEVKKMGADFLIGVEVSSHELYKKEELESIVKIMEQMVSYQMVTDADTTKYKDVDLYIKPVDEAYSTFSFDKAREIIDFGYQKTIEQIESLNNLALKQGKHKVVKKKVVVLDKFVVEKINVSGNEKYNYSYIIDKAQIKLGKIISFEDLFNGINRLWATDNFSQIQHKVVMNGGEGTIYIDVKESPKSAYIQIGPHYDEVFDLGVTLNWSDKQLLFDRDYLSTDFIVGKNLRYNFNYFVDNGIHLSVGLQSVYQGFDYDADFETGESSFPEVYDDKNLSFQNISNKLNFQYVYRDHFAWGFGLKHQFFRIKDIGEDREIVEDFNTEGVYTYLKYDTYDNKMHPKSGTFFIAEGDWYLAAQKKDLNFKPFAQGKMKFGHVFSIRDKTTLQIQTEAGITFNENPFPFLDFHLGGTQDYATDRIISLYGYPLATFGNSSYLKSGVCLKYEFAKNQFIGVRANAARAEQNFLEKFDFFSNTHKGLSVYYGARTLAGPVELSLSRSPELDKHYFTVRVGYWF